MSDFRIAFGRILKAFFPDRCSICGDVVELDTELCESCKSIDMISPPLCDYCGCSKDDCKCKKHKMEYKRIIAPFYYEKGVRKGVKRFKRDMPFLAEGYASYMNEVICREYTDINFDFIVPVPMTERDMKKRGYNQAKLLADELSRLSGTAVFECVYKNRRTSPQKGMSSKERKVNLYGAFDLTDKSAAQGKTFLLVDDVKTTGSTLNECAKMLNIYGANAVYAVTVAVTKR